jgi:PAS domain S-box-containing protein
MKKAANLDRKIVELQEQVRILQRENEELAERSEDTLLLGLISEAIHDQPDIETILANVLEKVSVLKNIPLSACCSVKDDRLSVLKSYLSFSHDDLLDDEISVAEDFIDKLLNDPAIFYYTESNGNDIPVQLMRRSFVAREMLIMPFRTRWIPAGIFLFGEDSSDQRLSSMRVVLDRIAEMIVARIDNLSLLKELKELNIDLDKKVQDRTKELSKTVLELNQEITERKHAETALRGSEEKVRLLLNSVYEAIYGVDTNGNCTFCNPSCLRLLGYEEEEDLIGKTVHDLIHHTYPDGTLYPSDECRIYNAYINKKGVHSDNEIFWRADGSSFFVEYWSYPVIKDEEVIGAVVNFIDITERKKAEDSLRQAESEWRNTFDSISDFASIHDIDFRIVRANKALADFFGVRPEELVGKRCYNLFHNTDEAWHNCPHAKAIERKAPSTEEIYDPNIGLFLLVTCSPIFNDKGDLMGSIHIAKDITDRKKTEERLAFSESYLRSIINNEPECVKLYEPDGTLIEMNPSGLLMIEADSLEEVIGKNICDIVDPEYREAFRNLAENVFHGNEGNLEFKITGLKGTTRWLETQAVPFKYTQEKRTVILAVTRDITERKLMEEELQKTEKLESLGILAGGIAHDFNNLLQSIFLNVSIAKLSAEKGSKVYEILMETIKNLERTRDLTQQLLTFSKGGEPIKDTITLGSLIKNAVKFSLSGSNVNSEISIADDLWAVDADEGQINQVMQNLIINADQAMPKGGIVRVRAENIEIGARYNVSLEEGRYVVVRIEDAGSGISEENLSKIFDPFFTTKQEGSGLGLATAYSIIKKHGGLVQVESKLGIGTAFTIYLPISEKKIKRESGLDEELYVGRGRVLVMDDEASIRPSMNLIMKKLGYEVEFADEGSQAVVMYKQAQETGRPFDMIILDLTVPGGMGGAETIEKLLEIDPQVKAIVSSGYADDLRLAEYGNYGFKAALFKPYHIEELSRTLHEVISAKSDK